MLFAKFLQRLACRPDASRLDIGEAAETKSAGSIIFSGTLAEGLHSIQGSDHIKVRLPKAAKFRVDASTTGGVITSDFPVKEEGERTPTRLIGLIDDEQKTFLRLRNRGGPILIEQEP